jgi:hypothetical protein
MYNQPTQVLPTGKVVGKLYKNPFDCLWKTLQTEGVFGWYKGQHMCVDTLSIVLIRSRLHGTFHAHSASYVCLYCSVYISADEQSTRIITLTANDLILNIYKTLRDGKQALDIGLA